ncbi:hypothetical protein J8L73_10440 [Pseudoalteromonas sp. MMG006]|uniref:hypothetical protein n=1 Tax=unclassified Pseudoalteromonas TaxID=194690 RepID=UPI001B393244|nr:MULTISPECIES: hypothetical protein [unclassified Pseudoalteromonas]MBQ4799540.1 hypothetical protein [Pseudoalteromonas sp. MMG006]MBQ4858894.1 hypothetical protein [Pseudoalteromonas sp. MMG007]
MRCEYVEEVISSQITISAKTEYDFKLQFESLLEELKEPSGIVYVWRCLKDIPRLKGSSPIFYIGKAKYSFYDRYKSNISHELKEYWNRYSHIISEYGGFTVDVYKTSNPEVTENRFLYQYHQKCFELPPINLQSYREKLL